MSVSMQPSSDTSPKTAAENEKSEILLASTTKLEPLASETSVLVKACELAQVGVIRHQFMDKFLQLVHEVEFEFGFSTPADVFFQQALNNYGTFAREWINDLFIRNFHDQFVTCAILRVIAHFDYQQIHPNGLTMAAAAAAHKDMMTRMLCTLF